MLLALQDLIRYNISKIQKRTGFFFFFFLHGILELKHPHTRPSPAEPHLFAFIIFYSNWIVQIVIGKGFLFLVCSLKHTFFKKNWRCNLQKNWIYKRRRFGNDMVLPKSLHQALSSTFSKTPCLF